jgi:hypothetical protein
VTKEERSRRTAIGAGKRAIDPPLIDRSIGRTHHG